MTVTEKVEIVLGDAVTPNSWDADEPKTEIACTLSILKLISFLFHDNIAQDGAPLVPVTDCVVSALHEAQNVAVLLCNGVVD